MEGSQRLITKLFMPTFAMKQKLYALMKSIFDHYFLYSCLTLFGYADSLFGKFIVDFSMTCFNLFGIKVATLATDVMMTRT